MSLRKLFSRPPVTGRAAAPAPRAPSVPEPAPAPRNRRFVSGERVLCRCSFELPKRDPFSNYRERCEGFMVMNVRGGSLYTGQTIEESDVSKAFPPGTPSLVKHFTLYPDGADPIVVGKLHARYLKVTQGRRLRGLVLRFSGLSDAQLDLLNALPERFPVVQGSEEDAIPLEALRNL